MTYQEAVAITQTYGTYQRAEACGPECLAEYEEADEVIRITHFDECNFNLAS